MFMPPHQYWRGTTVPHHIVVGVPVRNEAEFVGDCLRALALQQGSADQAASLAIVLLVNNSTDDTAAIARALAPRLPCELHVIEHQFPSRHATAGHARRLAMQHAADLAAPDGILLTTDADGRVAPDWLEANLAALDAGADAVCGRAIIDPLDALLIPEHLHRDDAIECSYATLLDRIHDLLDPDPADPWPRHTEHSGASIAVKRELFVRAGGVPAVCLGEDRALIQAIRRMDGRIRHAPEVCVTVSGRTVGRARGGMADTMARRIIEQDRMIDDALEPAPDCVRRAASRRLLHEAWEGIGSSLHQAAELLILPVGTLQDLIAAPWFGSAWAIAEAASPALARRLVARAGLQEEIETASRIIESLVARTPVSQSIDSGSELA